MSETAQEITRDSISVEGLEDVFELSGTESGTPQETAGTSANEDPGQPGHITVDASCVASYVSTAEAAKVAGVDSRTIRRWFEQKKLRGQFSKGKLLIVREDLPTVEEAAEVVESGTPGTESGTPQETAGTSANEDPGQPGQSADSPQTPAVVFSEFLDRIERLSRENGELRALLDEQRRENEELRLLTDSQHKPAFWRRAWSWFIGR